MRQGYLSTSYWEVLVTEIKNISHMSKAKQNRYGLIPVKCADIILFQFEAYDEIFLTPFTFLNRKYVDYIHSMQTYLLHSL